MRYYPIDKDPSFYIETLKNWEKNSTCDERSKTKYGSNNICSPPDTYQQIYHPMLNRKKGLTKKNRKHIKANKNAKIYHKDYDECDRVVVRYWNDLCGSRIDKIKNNNLHFDDWSTTRIKKGAYLPIFSETRYIKCTSGPPCNFTNASVPMSLRCVRKIQDFEALERKFHKFKCHCEREAAILRKGMHTDSLFHKLRHFVDVFNRATREINHDTL